MCTLINRLILLCLGLYSLALSAQKTLPIVQAPNDIIVSPGFEFDMNAITNPEDTTFGKVVLDSSLRKELITYDILCSDMLKYINPAYIDESYDSTNILAKYHIHWGKDGFVQIDSSIPKDSIKVYINVNDGRECGLGVITRTITIIFDGVRYQDKQQIWLADCNFFYINPYDCQDSTDNIIWPNACMDTLHISCEDTAILWYSKCQLTNLHLLHPSQLMNIHIDYTDRVSFYQKSFYILDRDWSVLDWCHYDPDSIARDKDGVPYGPTHPYPGEWHYFETFYVTDHEAPVITCKSDTIDFHIDSTGKVIIKTVDILGEITDNCTRIYHANNISSFLFFNNSRSFTSLLIPCDSINKETGEYHIPIQLWGEDSYENTSYCSTVIRVTDPTHLCKSISNKDIDIERYEISVYPNPVKDNWNLSLQTQQKIIGQLTLYNLTGQVVYTKVIEFSKNQHSVSLNRPECIESGMYFMKWNSADSETIQRIIFTD